MRWQKKTRFRFFRGQRGVSLIEVLVVVGILGLIGTVVIRGLDTNYRADRTLDEQVTAVNLGTAYIEAIKNLPYAVSYPTVGYNITVPTQYSVVVSTQCSSDAQNFGPCTSNASGTFQKITVSISREGRPVISICSFRTKR